MIFCGWSTRVGTLNSFSGLPAKLITGGFIWLQPLFPNLQKTAAWSPTCPPSQPRHEMCPWFGN